jgi:hypothetical protein
LAKFSRVRRSSAAHSSSRFCPIERVRPDPVEPSFWVQLVRGSGSLFELRVQSPAPSYPGAHALRPGTGRPRVGPPTPIATLSRLLSQHADPPVAPTPRGDVSTPARAPSTGASRAHGRSPGVSSRAERGVASAGSAVPPDAPLSPLFAFPRARGLFRACSRDPIAENPPGLPSPARRASAEHGALIRAESRSRRGGERWPVL